MNLRMKNGGLLLPLMKEVRKLMQNDLAILIEALSSP